MQALSPQCSPLRAARCASSRPSTTYGPLNPACPSMPRAVYDLSIQAWRLQALRSAIRRLHPDYPLWRDFPTYEFGIWLDVSTARPVREWVDATPPGDLERSPRLRARLGNQRTLPRYLLTPPPSGEWRKRVPVMYAAKEGRSIPMHSCSLLSLVDAGIESPEMRSARSRDFGSLSMDASTSPATSKARRELDLIADARQPRGVTTRLLATRPSCPIQRRIAAASDRRAPSRSRREALRHDRGFKVLTERSSNGRRMAFRRA